MSGYTQIVGSSSGVANAVSVNSSGKLLVVDSASSGLLTTIDSSNTAIQTAVEGTLNVAGSFYQATQPVSIAGAVATTGTYFQATQPVSIAGTVAVSAPTVSATSTVLESATAVADTATEVSPSTDLDAVKRCVVFGSLDDTSGNIVVEVSSDGTTWYENNEQSIYVDANNHYHKTMEVDAQHLRLKYTNMSGSTKTWNAVISYKN